MARLLNDNIEDHIERPSQNADEYKETMEHGHWIAHSEPIQACSKYDDGFLYAEKIVKLELTLHLKKVSEHSIRKNKYRDTFSTVKPWVHIKKSHIIGANVGLFASKTFLKGDIISVYLGTRKQHGQPTIYSLEHRNKIIDPSDGDDKLLYWGAHFANDAKHDKFKDGKKTRNLINNARFKGIKVIATTLIRPGCEILLAYNIGGEDADGSDDSDQDSNISDMYV
jgi:hypothetical protein